MAGKKHVASFSALGTKGLVQVKESGDAKVRPPPSNQTPFSYKLHGEFGVSRVISGASGSGPSVLASY